MNSQVFRNASILIFLAACGFLYFSLNGVREEYHADQFLVDHSIDTNSGLKGFEVGVPRAVDLSGALEKLVEWSAPEDYENQVRDWLLYTLVAAATENVNEIIDVTAVTSPLRRRYMSPSTQFQNTTVRSAVVGDGTIIVLLPRNAPDAFRSDVIAKATDYHAMAQGYKINRALVVDYWLFPGQKNADSIDTATIAGIEVAVPPQELAATLTLREEIPQEILYSNQFGWVQKQVSSQKELDEFLNTADDLVSVELNQSSVLMSGRDYKYRSYGKLNREHIATLWQSRQKQKEMARLDEVRQSQLVKRLLLWAVNQRLTGENAELADLVTEVIETGSVRLPPGAPQRARRQIEDFVDEFQNQIRSEVEPLWEAWSTCQWEEIKLNVNQLKKKKNISPDEVSFLKFVEEFEAYQNGFTVQQRAQLRDPGFSLDPSYDVEILSERFNDYLKNGHPQIVEVLSGFRSELQQSFEEGNTKLLECLLDTANKSNNREIAREINSRILDPSSYQQARYDGMLAGTEVGQILFITDLLAKLIDMDFERIYGAYFPNGDVNWTPTVYSQVSKAYELRMESFPGTRIWFGLREDAYNTTSAKRDIFFGPVVTRVYALSSGAFAQDRKSERQPNYLSAEFVDWFNQNYDRVAEAEPHYDRLNQLTKWSSVIYSPAFEELSFLSDTRVRRDLWFPDWVKSQPERPFVVSWVNCFYARGKYRQDVETMYILHAGWLWRDEAGEFIDPANDRWCDGLSGLGLEQQFDRIWSVRGGVSLPGSKSIEKVGTRAFSDHPLLRHADAVTVKKSQSGDSIRLSFAEEYSARRTVEVKYDIGDGVAEVIRRKQSGERTTQGTWKSGEGKVYFRGPQTEIRQQAISDRILGSPRNENFLIETRIGDVPVTRTQFDVSDTRLAVRQERLSLETAESLSLGVSRLPENEWVSFFAKQPAVRKALETTDNRYFVQFRNDGRWFEFNGTTNPTLDLPKGSIQRTSPPKNSIDGWIAEMRDQGSPVSDALAALETKVVSTRPVTEEIVFSQLKTTEYLEVRKIVADSGAMSLEIRAPPGGEPPIPPGGVGFKAGGPDGSGRPRLSLWINRDSDQAIITKEAIRSKNTFDDVFAFIENHNLKELVSKQSDAGAPIFVGKSERPDYVTSDQIAKVSTAIKATESMNFGANPQAFVDAVRSNRADALDLIVRAERNEQYEFLTQAVNRFTEITRATPSEAEMISMARLRADNASLAREVQRNKTLTRTEKIEELSALVSKRSSAEDYKDARALQTEGEVWAANVKTFESGRSDLSYKVLNIDGFPHLAVSFPPVVESVERANKIDFTGKVVFARSNVFGPDTSLNATVNTLPPNMVAMRLSDPTQGLAERITAANAEAILLGSGRTSFKRVQPSNPRIMEPITSAEYSKAIETILSTPMPIFPPPPPGGGGADGDEGDDASAPLLETSLPGIWIVADCIEVEGYLAQRNGGYLHEDTCELLTGREAAER
ncbi:hypothetical protein IWQ54_006578 [Labrenzia sp. EL_195]|nr:hypothetical protein [Labrenzia sp. EL_195]